MTVKAIVSSFYLFFLFHFFQLVPLVKRKPKLRIYPEIFLFLQRQKWDTIINAVFVAKTTTKNNTRNKDYGKKITD